MDAVRRYYAGSQLLAICVPADYSGKGITFFTPPNLSQQMAQMRHPANHVIHAHDHRLQQREILYTSEALFVRRGSARVDLYDTGRRYVGSLTIRSGDVLLLISGGHGFETLEECDMIEIKQGPYAGEEDKVRFPAIDVQQIVDADFR